MRYLWILPCFLTAALAQSSGQGSNLASSKAFYDQIKGLVLKSADKLPEEKYSYRPVETVRTYGELLAHIADANFGLCGNAKEGKFAPRGIEKSAKTKADIVKGLNEAFAYCDSVYAGLTDAASTATVSMFGQQRTKLSVLDFNIAHTFEHYGNLVTYMRMNGVVPPSSEGR
jgi:uncharacterized damage-inducible protein DinB